VSLRALFHRGRINARRIRQTEATLWEAAAPAICEILESRRLLATHLYTIPSGHTVAYVQPLTGGLDGQIQVRLDDPITGLIEPAGRFFNTVGMDIID
jgi:hypothetical protein